MIEGSIIDISPVWLNLVFCFVEPYRLLQFFLSSYIRLAIGIRCFMTSVFILVICTVRAFNFSRRAILSLMITRAVTTTRRFGASVLEVMVTLTLITTSDMKVIKHFADSKINTQFITSCCDCCSDFV